MSRVRINIPLMSLEQIGYGDCLTLFWIRNHRSVRQALTIKNKISFIKHVSWFYNELLRKKKTHIFLVKKNSKAIGFVLLRNFSADRKNVEIGVMVRNSEEHRFLVPYIMTLAVYYSVTCLEISSFYSYVSRDNFLAQSLNSRFGGKIVPSDKEDLKYFVSKEDCLQSDPYRKIIGRIGKQVIITRL